MHHQGGCSYVSYTQEALLLVLIVSGSFWTDQADRDLYQRTGVNTCTLVDTLDIHVLAALPMAMYMWHVPVDTYTAISYVCMCIFSEAVYMCAAALFTPSRL